MVYLLKILNVANEKLCRAAVLRQHKTPARNISVFFEYQQLFSYEIIDGLLKNSIVISLVETLTYFQKVIAVRIDDIENGALKGVNNVSIN